MNNLKEQHGTVEEFIKANAKVLNKKAFRGFLFFIVFIFIFVQWVVNETPGWFLLTMLFGPIALNIFFSSMRRAEEFGRLQKNLVAAVVKDRLELCVKVGNSAPPAADTVRFFPVDKNPITLYTPLQWWSEDRALEAIKDENLRNIEVYKETLDPWVVDTFQGSLLVSLDNVFHDLFQLEELGVVGHFKGLQSEE